MMEEHEVVEAEGTIHRRRKMVPRVFLRRSVSYLLIALVFLSTSYYSWRIGGNSKDTQETSDIVKQMCIDNNAQDAKQLQLWEFIIALTANDVNPNRTPEEQERRVAEFRKFISQTFTKQDCG